MTFDPTGTGVPEDPATIEPVGRDRPGSRLPRLARLAVPVIAVIVAGAVLLQGMGTPADGAAAPSPTTPDGSAAASPTLGAAALATEDPPPGPVTGRE